VFLKCQIVTFAAI